VGQIVVSKLLEALASSDRKRFESGQRIFRVKTQGTSIILLLLRRAAIGSPIGGLDYLDR
jgi:hypothetical protein